MAPVAAVIAAPLRYHWSEGVGEPVTAKLNTAVVPSATVWDSGWSVTAIAVALTAWARIVKLVVVMYDEKRSDPGSVVVSAVGSTE